MKHINASFFVTGWSRTAAEGACGGSRSSCSDIVGSRRPTRIQTALYRALDALTHPAIHSEVGSTHDVPGASSVTAAANTLRQRVIGSLASLVERSRAALMTSETAAAPSPMSIALSVASIAGPSEASADAWAMQPRIAIDVVATSEKHAKATRPPYSPPIRTPSATASCVDDGPGRACVRANSDANAASSSTSGRHACTCMRATCAGGPPKAMAPSRRKRLATTSSDTCALSSLPPPPPPP